MRIEQKINFIKNYVKKYVDIKKWVYVYSKYKGDHGIAMSIDTLNRVIYLNKFWLNRVKDIIVLKSVILHEIGHFKTKNMSQKLWERELYAQTWACREAYRKKASVIYHNLVTELFLWGYPKYLKWNSYERKYILAHKAAIDRKIMQIIYNKNNGLSLFMDYHKVL